MCLTYDRPEMINKVVLKRRHSTGTWEVILHPDSSRSPAQTATNVSSSSSIKSPVVKSSVDNRSPLSSSSGSISSSPARCSKLLQREKQLTPLGQNLKVSKRGRIADPDYDPSSESVKKSNQSKPHKCTLSLSNCILSGSAPVISIPQTLSCSVVMTNHHSPNTENVSSRTRLKQVHSSPTISQSSPISPTLSNPKSPNHRYPTRNKQWCTYMLTGSHRSPVDTAWLDGCGWAQVCTES